MSRITGWVPALALLMAAAVVVPSAPLSAADDTALEKRIAAAKTPADHEAIAAEYEKSAAAAKADSESHKQMGAAYGKLGGALIQKQHLDTHCASLAELYAKVAAENEALAKAHHAMAKEAK